MELEAAIEATVAFTVGGDEVEIDGTVLSATARTVVLEMASGAATLALATTPVCELVLRGAGVAVRVDARPGRRFSDTPGSRRLELVLDDEGIDLTELLER